jgi:hypothetical protein
MNKIARFLAGIFVSVTVMGGCNNNPQKISNAQLKDLKNKYSAEEVNYFYETVFYQDFKGIKPALSKWKEDLRVCMQGTGWAGDSAYVKDALKQINALQLPVRLTLTNDVANANVLIHFGDQKYLNEKLGSDPLVTFRGIGKLDQIPGGGLMAMIGISNDAVSYKNLDTADQHLIRQSTILEEITQILGVTGDSWKDYRSIFFEGTKNIIQLQPIDKQVIRLLYEVSLPDGLSRQTFTEQFGDVLYASGTISKLATYVKQQKILADQLERISSASYPDSLLVRYSGKIFVKVEGEYNGNDIRFCREAIELLNSASDRFHLEYVEDSSLSDLPCINISFETHPDASPKAERWVKIGSLMVSRRIDGKIRIRSGKTGISEEAKHQLLFKAMYKILGYDGINGDIVQRNEDGRMQFRSGYKEALTLLYNPVFADGLSKSDLDEVIQDLK